MAPAAKGSHVPAYSDDDVDGCALGTGEDVSGQGKPTAG
jgi:hypothetical protein